jgi:hypothetical protein
MSLSPASDSHSSSNTNASNNTTTNDAPMNTMNDLTAQIVPAGGVKRKPNRCANTAERHATHNAIERQRRKTLSSHFLVRSCLALLNP